MKLTQTSDTINNNNKKECVTSQPGKARAATKEKTTSQLGPAVAAASAAD